MAAKDELISRIMSLNLAVAIDAVKDKALTDINHNNIARLLRNGLAVVGFVALEDFLKKRTSEVLNLVGTLGVKFEDLPEVVQHATTFEALSALSYQLSYRTDPDRLSYVQEHAAKIASTANAAYELTPHAFGYSQANLQHNEIKRILKAFFVNDPWGQMTRVSARLGLTALPLEATYDGASKRRHRAAHVASSSVPEVDLQSYIKEALAIAIAFDSLITKSVSKIKAYDMDYFRNIKKNIGGRYCF